MKFALIASVAVCCLSAVIAGPLDNPGQLAERNPIMDNYCDVVVTFVDYIRGLPESLEPMGCFTTSFIDRLCNTTFSGEFCIETSNSVKDEDDEDDDEGFENNHDDNDDDNNDDNDDDNNDDNDDDNETEVSTPGTDVEEPNSVITTTPTPNDTEAHTNPIDTSNPTEKSNLETTSTVGTKSKHSNKKSKNAKSKSKHTKSKGSHAKNKNVHGKSKGKSKTKSKGHNATNNKN